MQSIESDPIDSCVVSYRFHHGVHLSLGGHHDDQIQQPKTDVFTGRLLRICQIVLLFK